MSSHGLEGAWRDSFELAWEASARNSPLVELAESLDLMTAARAGASLDDVMALVDAK